MINGVRLRLFVATVFAIFVFSLTSVSAANSCSDSSQIIFRLSGDTNAHAEVFNGGSEYSSEVCYNQLFSNAPLPSVRTCTGDNIVLKISSDTNAHAEGPNEANYNNVICYRDLSCSLRTNCLGDEVPVVRLSDTTNAHLEIGSGNSYSRILCCSSQSAPGEGCVPSCAQGKICSKGDCVNPPTSSCGNGVINQGEGCDGSNFDGKTCENLMPGSVGSLSCKNCVIDMTQCKGVADVECNDEDDNDGDGLIDLEDPGCGGDPDNDDENPQCEDGIDNDGDGKVDLNDAGCGGDPSDDDERPECSDKKDNDGDGKIDGADSDCLNDDDNNEGQGVPGGKRVYWANINNNELADGATAEVGDSVHLVALGVPANSKVVFTIIDRDGFAEGIFDDEIATSPEVTESGNKAIYRWNIVPSDFEKGLSGDSDRVLELFFIARISGDDETSPTLLLIEKEIGPGPIPGMPVGCDAYNDEDYLKSLAGSPSIESACNNDLGKQLGSDPEYGPMDAGFKNKYDIGCNDRTTDTETGVTTETFCFCKLNTDGICSFDSDSKISFPDDGSGNVCTGSCKNEPEYGECVDDLQTITIKGVVENINNCNADQIEELESNCAEETSTDVSCGASRLLLPFFGKIQFLISALIILAIYICLADRKRSQGF